MMVLLVISAYGRELTAGGDPKFCLIGTIPAGAQCLLENCIFLCANKFGGATEGKCIKNSICQCYWFC
ncbi:unnamed protein product [Linum tenue]|nr:unnamed protein product [Linum tenue]